jgi:hypothetical protein
MSSRSRDAMEAMASVIARSREAFQSVAGADGAGEAPDPSALPAVF